MAKLFAGRKSDDLIDHRFTQSSAPVPRCPGDMRGHQHVRKVSHWVAGLDRLLWKDIKCCSEAT